MPVQRSHSHELLLADLTIEEFLVVIDAAALASLRLYQRLQQPRLAVVLHRIVAVAVALRHPRLLLHGNWIAMHVDPVSSHRLLGGKNL